MLLKSAEEIIDACNYADPVTEQLLHLVLDDIVKSLNYWQCVLCCGTTPWLMINAMESITNTESYYGAKRREWFSPIARHGISLKPK